MVVVGETDPLSGGIGLVFVGAAAQRARREGRNYVATVEPTAARLPEFAGSTVRIDANDHTTANGEVVGEAGFEGVNGDHLAVVQEAGSADTEYARSGFVKDILSTGAYVDSS